MSEFTVKRENNILGRQGEKNVTTLIFDVTDWVNERPNGTFDLWLKRSIDELPYLAASDLTPEAVGNRKLVKYTIQELDTQVSGIGSMQLRYYYTDTDLEADSFEYKTPVYQVKVDDSLGAEPVEPIGWDDYFEKVKDAADAAEAARDQYPIISEENANWLIWDAAQGKRIDTGVQSIGPAAGFGTPIASIIDKTPGNPTVIINASGPDTAKVFEFKFAHLTGEGFSVYKTYTSIEAMEADLDNIPEGKFVLIASNIEDPDNAKLYIRAKDSFKFLTDMSNATGIKGDAGDPAGFGNITTETKDDGPGIPSVVITPSGPDTAKNFHFEFSHLEGQQGIQGYSIAEIEKESGSGAAGTVDTYKVLINDSDSTKIGSFDVYNGKDGIDGIDGDSVTITSTSVQYGVSSSSQTMPTTWIDEIPLIEQGEFLWNRTIVVYSDGNSTTTYNVSRQGVDGVGSISTINGHGPDTNRNVQLYGDDFINMTVNEDDILVVDFNYRPEI